MSKLTLSVDDVVVRRAKRYAEKEGTSVSRLVEQYLDVLSNGASEPGATATPLLERLRSELKGVSVDAAHYRKYLESKYR